MTDSTSGSGCSGASTLRLGGCEFDPQPDQPDRTPPPCSLDVPPSVPDWSDLGSVRVTVTFMVKVTAKTVNQRSESDKTELLRPIVGFMISWPGRSKEY